MNENNNFNSNIGMNFNQVQSNSTNVLPTNKKKSHKIVILILSIIIIALIIFIIYLLMFFEGTKILKCVQEEEMSGMNLLGTANIYFKKNKVEQVDMKIEVDLGEYIDYKDVFIEKFSEEYSTYGDGIDVDILSDDTKVYVEISANKNNFDKLDIINESNYDKVKTELESQGFKCE